ncbi:phosphatidate cytidylyltransferase [Lottiidibacillus patelloidae]|uniref:Phosphatidate cytidylyltransferase n=1 Tax=Lottiidibacillus patelloidae TaxID=2670334 RepID=A0A263BY06_9BACI|nr:phosphatidate cytidylyltransferase [Lottiidibacillus patelloidae]OZM58605.1 phosphatidate cytidylyltransferase [Lottiidibacillus patelloidae]
MKQRVLTGIIAGAAFIALTVLGGYPFAILVCLMAIIGLKELLAMKKKSIFSLSGLISVLILLVLVIPNDYFSQLDLHLNVFNIVVIGTLALLIITVLSKNEYTFEDAAVSLLTILYVGYGFHAFLDVRLNENGLPMLFFILFMIWATDSGAYFVGKSLGKTKLWPAISPNKTIEGSLGGVFAAVIVAVVFQMIQPLFDSMAYVLVIAIIVGVSGQLGDLIQSAFKRYYGVKDSGTLLPGHGGILDRFDSTIFVFSLLYVLQLI